MGNQMGRGYGKNICVGLLAHVDAGKTTLSEAILYTCGKTRRLGRVDHGDTVLDSGAMERERGITIFSKEARLSLGDWEVTLVDTPGHGDFGAETERALCALDYCVMIISASDGISGNTLTLWKLLEKHRIPVFLFVNKMDQPGADRQILLKLLDEKLSEHCVDMEAEDYKEALAMCHESLLDEYIKTEDIRPDSLRQAIRQRKVFPTYFGSALQMQGVSGLLEGLKAYMEAPLYADEFGARVYKISREGNRRLTHMKITGGSLKVKARLPWGKVDQIRLYSGDRYELTDEVFAGEICAVAGLEGIGAGQGMGSEEEGLEFDLVPVLTYEMIASEGTDPFLLREGLKPLEEEIPEIHFEWREETGAISVSLMGRIQLEVLTRMIGERLGVEVSFGAGRILYLESPTAPVRGRGCGWGPGAGLEVSVRLEPGERGSGLAFKSLWGKELWELTLQEQVMESLKGQLPRGPLGGFGLTDVTIILEGIRGNKKLQEPEIVGEAMEMALCQALYRSRQQGEMLVLEPRYRFRMDLPIQSLGRAMNHIQWKKGRMDPPITQGDMVVLEGEVPAAGMEHYQEEILQFTGGRGRLWYCLAGYGPCHNQEEVVEDAMFDPLEEGQYRKSLRDGLLDMDADEEVEETFGAGDAGRRNKSGKGRTTLNGKSLDTDRELEEIFARTYRSSKTSRSTDLPARAETGEDSGAFRHRKREEVPREEYLLVDGYNIIFAWEELKILAKDNLDGARGRLMDILSDYQGYTGYQVILVFDAYRVKDNPGSVTRYHNMNVVYTKTAQTADQYIEMTAHQLKGKASVWVATSDALEQLIVWGQGAMRMSAGELKERIEEVGRRGLEGFYEGQVRERNYPFAENLGERSTR